MRHRPSLPLKLTKPPQYKQEIRGFNAQLKFLSRTRAIEVSTLRIALEDGCMSEFCNYDSNVYLVEHRNQPFTSAFVFIRQRALTKVK